VSEISILDFENATTSTKGKKEREKLTYKLGINAFLYMTLGRMVQFFVPEQSLIRISARRFGLIFVCLDILAFIVQLIGVGILVQTDAASDVVLRGVHIYMVGIAVQEIFIGLTIHLHRKLLEIERTGVQVGKMTNLAFNWRWLFYTMYFALTMITVCIFRQVHFGAFVLTLTSPNRFVSPSDWPNIRTALAPMSPPTLTSGTNTSSMLYRCSSLFLFSTSFTPVGFSKALILASDTRRRSPRWKRNRGNSKRKVHTQWPVIMFL
jgi:hypothetical protein